MNTRTEHAPGPAAVRGTPYNRTRWERAVMTSRLDGRTRLVAFVLAHHGGEDGFLEADGIQNRSRLAGPTRLSYDALKSCLRALEREGFIKRPVSTGEHTRLARPITLTVPAPRARGDLPSTGEVTG